MVDTTTTPLTGTNNNITIKTLDSTITEASILIDVDMRTGTPVSETGWLDGGAAAGSYPGALDGFKAKNTNVTNAAGSLRLITLQCNLEGAAVSVIVFPKGLNKIVSILGTQMPLADKTLSARFLNTGIENAFDAAAAMTGGSLPAIELHAEGAVDLVSVSFLALAN
tara:strand:+ start:66 stop:566 length:501 start_codon:yes stop_codon:yes gene_type:complete